MQQLPRYKSHKVVQAAKITSIDYHPNCIMIHSAEGAPFQLSLKYDKKHNPQPGGYFVVYEDNYLSYSPAEAFEGGYTLIREPKSPMLVIRSSVEGCPGQLPANYNELRLDAPKSPDCPYCGDQTVELLIENEEGNWIFSWSCSCEGATAREGGS